MQPQNRLHLSGAAAIAGSLAACATIPSGRTGVEWSLTNGTMDRTLDEGFHFVSPFSKIYQVDLREQQRDVDLNVLADNGLDIQLKTSILYQPIAGNLSDKVLAWQGIKATQSLAESPNAKVVVIGSGKEGLPLIFNATGPAASAVAKNSP
jgi:SPFH domain / Band 7 family